MSGHETAKDSSMQDADCRIIKVNACVAGKRMPPPGWTKADPKVKSAFPLQLSRRDESAYHST